jgi:hypothetical protein
MQKIQLLQLNTMQDTDTFVDNMLTRKMSEDSEEAAEPDYPILYDYIYSSKCPSQVRKVMVVGLHTAYQVVQKLISDADKRTVPRSTPTPRPELTPREPSVQCLGTTAPTKDRTALYSVAAGLEFVLEPRELTKDERQKMQLGRLNITFLENF